MKTKYTLRIQILTWINTKRFHFLCWSVFMLYESLAVFLATGISGHILSYLLHYALNIGLFYFHAHVVLPMALKKPGHRFWRVPLLIALEIFLYLIIGYFLDVLLANYTTTLSSAEVLFDQRFISGGLWRAIYFIGFSSGYYFLKNYLLELRTTAILQQQALEQIIREKQMTIELAQARDAYLRAQINPHLLFNTLNFMYNQVRKINTTVASSILLLSDIMRYAIEQDQDSGLKPLEGEIQQTKNLIELWQIRQRIPTYIAFNADEAAEQFPFISLVLLTLTENIFKHGDLTRDDHPATISVTFRKGIFRIATDNLIHEQLNDTGCHSGLQNIKQRLLYAFGEAALFKYNKEANNHFTAVIEINSLMAPF